MVMTASRSDGRQGGITVIVLISCQLTLVKYAQEKEIVYMYFSCAYLTPVHTRVFLCLCLSQKFESGFNLHIKSRLLAKFHIKTLHFYEIDYHL